MNIKKTCPCCFQKVNIDENGNIEFHNIENKEIYRNKCLGKGFLPLEESDEGFFNLIHYLNFILSNEERALSDLNTIKKLCYFSINNQGEDELPIKEYKYGDDDFNIVIEKIKNETERKIQNIKNELKNLELKKEKNVLIKK